MTLGQKIRNRREELGLTQPELSEKSGVSQPYISLLEKNRINPSVTYAVKISKALAISVEELIDERADKNGIRS